MHKIKHLLGALAILLLLTGCTSFQVKEAQRSIALGLFEMVLDGVIDESPYELSAHSQYINDVAEREEEARRRDEREKRHYEEEAQARFAAYEQPEPTKTDYERREEERFTRREETFKNKAEFDRFMRELEAAEERNNGRSAALIISEQITLVETCRHESACGLHTR